MYFFYSILLILIFTLVFVIAFSVYPSYILRANHGTAFRYGQKVSNSILDFCGFEKGKSTIWSDILFPAPLKINQEFYVGVKDFPDGIFINKSNNEYIYHSPMMPDPFVTYALLPGEYLSVKNSIQQFRYNEILKEKEIDEIRIFITGGSTAWGALAPNNESTIGGFLESKLTKRIPGKNIKVITAAAGAWNSTQERIWIFNRITEFKPDVIISYSGHNDIFDVALNSEDLFNTYWYDGAYYYNSILQYEKFNRGIDIAENIEKIRQLQKVDYEDDFPRKTFKNVQIINSYLKGLDCNYYYFLQPVREKERNEVQKYFDKLSYDLSVYANKENNFSFHDHSEIFDNQNEIFFDRCHIGDIGNEIIAEKIYEILISNYFVKRGFTQSIKR